MVMKSYKLFILSTQACSSAPNASLTSIETGKLRERDEAAEVVEELWWN